MLARDTRHDTRLDRVSRQPLVIEILSEMSLVGRPPATLGGARDTYSGNGDRAGEMVREGPNRSQAAL